MNRIFKHKILAGAMLFGFMLAGSSCEDNVGINVTPETPYADKTLYEIIKSDPELANFVAVIDACGEKWADSLFNKPRVYTVWAPVIGDAERDELIARVAAGKRDDVFRSFVTAHIANYLVPANGELKADNKILLLNNKNAIFTGDYKNGYTFADVNLDLNSSNIRAWNGILHKITTSSEYKYSIWEYLKVAENADSVAKYLYDFNLTEFNAGQSIEGPIINGEQTYIDSVFTTSNIWLNPWSGVGNLDNEDSLYTVYIPSNEMWSRVVKETESFFNYDLAYASLTEVQKYERDSLRRYYSRMHNLKYITYSMNEQRHVEPADSAMPAYRGVFERPLFAKGDIDNDENLVYEKKLSNGTFKVVDKMPYKHTDLYHDTIFLEAENQAMWSPQGTDSTMFKNSRIEYAYKDQLNEDSLLLGSQISGNAYYSYPREKDKATAFFKIPKVLSAKYYMALIMVPKHITDEYFDKSKLYPNILEISLTQDRGTKNEEGGFMDYLYEANYDDADILPLITDPFRVDTLFLTDENGDRAVIEPEFCEFYDGKSAKDYNIELKVNTLESIRGVPVGDMSLRIDKIMLIPVPDTEE